MEKVIQAQKVVFLKNSSWAHSTESNTCTSWVLWFKPKSTLWSKSVLISNFAAFLQHRISSIENDIVENTALHAVTVTSTNNIGEFLLLSAETNWSTKVNCCANIRLVPPNQPSYVLKFVLQFYYCKRIIALDEIITSRTRNLKSLPAVMMHFRHVFWSILSEEEWGE